MNEVLLALRTRSKGLEKILESYLAIRPRYCGSARSIPLSSSLQIDVIHDTQYTITFGIDAYAWPGVVVCVCIVMGVDVSYAQSIYIRAVSLIPKTAQTLKTIRSSIQRMARGFFWKIDEDPEFLLTANPAACV